MPPGQRIRYEGVGEAQEMRQKNQSPVPMVHTTMLPHFKVRVMPATTNAYNQ